jgi:hypothetical protein
MDTNDRQHKRYAIASEIAVRYRTSPAQIYDWTRQGKFPATAILRIGKKILYDLEALEDWAERGGSPAKAQRVA